MKIYYMKAQGCMKPYLSHYSITKYKKIQFILFVDMESDITSMSE